MNCIAGRKLGKIEEKMRNFTKLHEKNPGTLESIVEELDDIETKQQEIASMYMLDIHRARAVNFYS